MSGCICAFFVESGATYGLNYPPPTMYTYSKSGDFHLSPNLIFGGEAGLLSYRICDNWQYGAKHKRALCGKNG
jgi:hypothetical protein